MEGGGGHDLSLRMLSSSSAPPGSPSSSSSSTSRSPSSSKVTYSPERECEEIPSQRWLALVFGRRPSQRRSYDGRGSRPNEEPEPVAVASISSGVWKKKQLPPGYEKILARAVVPVRFSSFADLHNRLRTPILIDEGRKSFWLDKATGKNCFMLSARDLEISPVRSKWTTSPKSRFSGVAKLRDDALIRILGRIDVRELSPGTRYAVHLVFDFSSGSVESPTLRPFDGVGEDVWLQWEERGDGVGEGNRRRSDGWMDVIIGDFVVEHANEWWRTVLVRLVDRRNIDPLFYHPVWFGDRRGLVVEGIDITPMDDLGNGVNRDRAATPRR